MFSCLSVLNNHKYWKEGRQKVGLSLLCYRWRMVLQWPLPNKKLINYFYQGNFPKGGFTVAASTHMLVAMSTAFRVLAGFVCSTETHQAAFPSAGKGNPA